ncbi:MAG: TlpA disulfide reductase family protein [Balneolaceae bacterium]|jgi:peroxiredoxin
MQKLSLFIVLITVLAFGSLSCSSDSQKTRIRATRPVQRLDPYSAPLYKSQNPVQATDFKVSLLNGDSFSLSSHREKAVLMNIWATWCAPCREETPEFVNLYNKYNDDGLVILGVSIDKQGKSVVRPFMEKYKVNYPIVIDDGTIMDKYGPTMGIPTTYLIDKEGKLQYFAVGALTQKELEPRIKKLLGE